MSKSILERMREGKKAYLNSIQAQRDEYARKLKLLYIPSFFIIALVLGFIMDDYIDRATAHTILLPTGLIGAYALAEFKALAKFPDKEKPRQ